MSFTSVLLPEPETPVTTVMRSDGDLHVDALQVVAARSLDLEQQLRIEVAPLRGQRNLAPARQILPGQRRRVRADLLRRALRDDLAAVHAGTGPQIHDVVRREDRLAVVLDDEHGVAEVAQVDQRVE